MLAIVCHDDASMWVKKPQSPSELISNPAGTRMEKVLSKKMAIRGSNVHMPVINMCEVICVDREVPSATNAGVRAVASHACEMTTPAQVVPSATAGTLFHRKKRWCFHNASGPGSCKVACAQGVDVFEQWRKTPWKLSVCCSDNLLTNGCVQALEERDLAAFNASLPDDGRHEHLRQTYLDIKCGGPGARGQGPRGNDLRGPDSTETSYVYIARPGRAPGAPDQARGFGRARASGPGLGAGAGAPGPRPTLCPLRN